MREQLSQIDLSPLAELVRIKREEEILAERLVKIEDRADKVSKTVYDRVKRDYETRKASLEQESRPLKEKARAEYRRLDVLRAEVEKSVEAASLDKEELELRKDLGEFPDKEYKERLAACETKLNGEQKDLEEVARTKAKFLEAFHSEDELAAPAPEATSAPTPEATSAPTPAPARSVSATFVPPSADATVIQVSRPVPEPGREPTRALPRMRLALLDGDAVVREFPVKPGISVIGRLAQSDIHLPTPDVSRRHAQIVFGEDGCFVVDLGSENGVVVNGTRVAKHKLADGDVILLGKQRLRCLA